MLLNITTFLASLASLFSKQEAATELGDNKEKSAVSFAARIMEDPASVSYSDLS